MDARSRGRAPWHVRARPEWRTRNRGVVPAGRGGPETTDYDEKNEGGRTMADCIFCKIAGGDIQAQLVFESDELLAIEDINPVAPVHILIVPRKHIETINDLTSADSELLGNMFLCAKNLASERGISKSGYRAVMNCMSGAGQSVFHIHLHLLGGRVFQWPPG